MSNLLVWTNNASSLLASSITGASTTVVVTAGQGALFPAIAAGQYTVGTLEDTSGNIEVVWVTGRTTDTMTITRAQEGTSALSFASGSRFELRVTAGVLATLLQKTGADILSGTTTLGGVLSMNGSGSIQNGEIAGAALRGAPGLTTNQILLPSDGSVPTVGGSPILSTSNIVTHMPAGAGLVITGMVLFWSGASNAIPSGYTLCDGTAGTPDLRDKFIVGGGGALPTTGGANSGSTGATDPGGALSIGSTSLTIDQIPAHNHTIKGGLDTLNGAGPGFAITGFPGGAHFPGPHGEDDNGHTETTGPAGVMSGSPHTHSLSGSLLHTHAITLPPYRAVFAIMKT